MSGIYNTSLSEEELDAYTLAEAKSGDSPDNWAYVPDKDHPSTWKLDIGDPDHAWRAVQAFTGKFRGNTTLIPSNKKASVSAKIAGAVRKFFKGDEQKYYLSWLHTGKKPSDKAASEMRYKLTEIRFTTPSFTAEDEKKFPEVPISEAVDWEGIQRLDPSPKVVTRPLGILDATSDNNLKYTAEMLDEILQQVLSKRPPARLGHVSEADRSWSVPPSQAYWIGALDDPGTVFGKRTIFGKAYIRSGTDLREMMVIQDLTGTPMSNSVFGLADLADNDDGTVSSQSMEIESIDFVPPERAALKALGGDFDITSEMKEGAMADQHSDAAADLASFKNAITSIKPEDIHDMLHEAGRAHEVATAHVRMHEIGNGCKEGKLHEMLSREGRAKVAEMHLREEATPDETYQMLSEAHRAHVAECFAKEMGNTMKPVQEETKTKEAVGEMSKRVTEMSKQMSEMQAQLAAYKRADFERALDRAVDAKFAGFHEPVTDKGKAGFATLKDSLRFRSLSEMAGMKDGQTEENISSAVETAYPSVKPLIEMFIASAGGPPAIVGQAGTAKEGNRVGINQTTGFFDRDFMREARQVAAGAVRNTPRKKG